MSDTKGYIYILTNPSFPQYVKIGYADNVEKRLDQLNRSECIPFAFRVYATYEVQSRLSDLKVHSIRNLQQKIISLTQILQNGNRILIRNSLFSKTNMKIRAVNLKLNILKISKLIWKIFRIVLLNRFQKFHFRSNKNRKNYRIL